MNCRAYAKGLHYKEEEFHRGVTPKLLESLIAINNKLQQPDAAAGVLEYAKQHGKGDFVSGEYERRDGEKWKKEEAMDVAFLYVSVVSVCLPNSVNLQCSTVSLMWSHCEICRMCGSLPIGCHSMDPQIVQIPRSCRKVYEYMHARVHV